MSSRARNEKYGLFFKTVEKLGNIQIKIFGI